MRGHPLIYFFQNRGLTLAGNAKKRTTNKNSQDPVAVAVLVFFTFFFARSPLDSRAASLRDRFETVAGATGDGLAVRVSSRGSPPLALMTLFWWRTFLYPFCRNRFAASESLW